MNSWSTICPKTPFIKILERFKLYLMTITPKRSVEVRGDTVYIYEKNVLFGELPFFYLPNCTPDRKHWAITEKKGLYKSEYFN